MDLAFQIWLKDEEIRLMEVSSCTTLVAYRINISPSCFGPTACGHRIAHRKWKETKLQPGTARPGNRIGCCLVSFHFLWGKLCLRRYISISRLPKSRLTRREDFSPALSRGLVGSYVQWARRRGAVASHFREFALNFLLQGWRQMPVSYKYTHYSYQ